MYYVDLPIFALILWVIFALIVLLPWILIPAVAVYKFFQVLKLPKESKVKEKFEFDPITNNLGLTMADGGEKVKKTHS